MHKPIKMSLLRMECAMKKTLILSGLLILLISLVAVAGCGDQDAGTEEATKVAVTHDCAGDCGMTNMTPEQTKEIDGKFYCTGCAKKVEADDPHAGHSH